MDRAAKEFLKELALKGIIVGFSEKRIYAFNSFSVASLGLAQRHHVGAAEELSILSQLPHGA